MHDIHSELGALADHLHEHHEEVLISWRKAVQKDANMTTGESLPLSELFDHIPSLLRAFERGIRGATGSAELRTEKEAQDEGAAHGLQRWQQGFDLREVTREWGKLNHAVVAELDRFAEAHSDVSLQGMSHAREVWTILCSTGIEASVDQYYTLQRQEAAGHVKDLETALKQVRALEQQRGELWQQAAHDLRGNLGVVANVTVGLTRQGRNDGLREDFVRILMRNVTSLHHLLDDITSLARLQAGREVRHIEPLDVTGIFEPLCEGIRPLAKERGLKLLSAGPDGFAVEGDAVKIRRIAQNLILNAVKYTRAGSITVSWGESEPDDPKRWLLCIADTGPGFHTDSGQPIASALDPAHTASTPPMISSAERFADRTRYLDKEAGEGIGLSIVKRLCEILDAKIEMRSVKDVGTTFRILFPRQYHD